MCAANEITSYEGFTKKIDLFKKVFKSVINATTLPRTVFFYAIFPKHQSIDFSIICICICIFFFIYNISAEILFQRISFVKVYSFPLFFRLLLSFKSRCTIVACFCEFVFLCLFERCFDIDMGRQLQATTDANALHRSLWFMIMKIVFAPTCNADGLRVRIHTGSGCEQKTFHFISEEKKSKWKHNSHITHNARNFNILAFSVWIANRTVATEFIALHAIVSRPQCNAMRCYYLLQRSK